MKTATQDSFKTVVDILNTYKNLVITKDACTKTSNNIYYYITTEISNAFYKEYTENSEQANNDYDKIKAFSKQVAAFTEDESTSER